MPERIFRGMLPAVNALTPAVQRVIVARKADGSLEIQSTTDEENAIRMLDEAMEAIDGNRLPPE